MVSETTETSITWTWNAVEGALAYQVQVSADEMFDDTDMIHPTAETTYSSSASPVRILTQSTAFAVALTGLFSPPRPVGRG